MAKTETKKVHVNMHVDAHAALLRAKVDTGKTLDRLVNDAVRTVYIGTGVRLSAVRNG